MSYIVLENSEDGELSMSLFETAAELLQELHERLEEYEKPIEFYKPEEITETLYDMGNHLDPGKLLVIEGKIIVPKPKKVVEKFSLDEEDA